MQHPITDYLLLLALPIGLVITLFGLYYLVKRNKLLKSGIDADGFVVEVTPVDRSKRPYTYGNPNSFGDVIIRFTTVTRQKITEKAQIAISTLKVGDTVKLVYNPENPTEFIITSPKFAGTALTIVISIGVLLSLFGIYKLAIFLMN